MTNDEQQMAGAGTTDNDDGNVANRTWWRCGVLLLGLLALLIIAASDALSASRLNPGTFYMLVMLGVTWCCGPWWGGLFAVLSSFAQLGVALDASGNVAEPLYFYLGLCNQFFAYLLSIFLVTVVRSNYTRLQAAARIDYTSGVTNSRGFYEKLSVEMARCRRSHAAFAVACFDCDYFKVVNEGLGRSEGDRALSVIGQVILANLRATDIVARLGGDEFALVLPNTGDAEAMQVVRKICAQLENAMTRHDWPITFSVGVGIFQRVPENVDGVIAFCERVMRRVKTGGRNRVMVEVFAASETAPAANPRTPLRVVR